MTGKSKRRSAASAFTYASTSAFPIVDATIPTCVTKKNLIKEVLEPLSFVSSDKDNVLMTFKAISVDGEEVVVDNKFLKHKNPLLLIDFYERHLKYTVNNG